MDLWNETLIMFSVFTSKLDKTNAQIILLQQIFTLLNGFWNYLKCIFIYSLLAPFVSVKCQRKAQKSDLFVHSVTISFQHLTCHVEQKMVRQMVKSCNWIPVVLVIVVNNWCFFDCSPCESRAQCKSQTSAINYILIKSHEVEVIYCCPCRKSQCLYCGPSIIFLKLERQRQIIQLQTSHY